MSLFVFGLSCTVALLYPQQWWPAYRTERRVRKTQMSWNNFGWKNLVIDANLNSNREFRQKMLSKWRGERSLRKWRVWWEGKGQWVTAVQSMLVITDVTGSMQPNGGRWQMCAELLNLLNAGQPLPPPFGAFSSGPVVLLLWRSTRLALNYIPGLQRARTVLQWAVDPSIHIMWAGGHGSTQWFNDPAPEVWGM